MVHFTSNLQLATSNFPDTISPMDERKRKVEGYFDEIVGDYTKLYEQDDQYAKFPSGPVRLEKTLRLLRQWKPGGTVLDVGCGTGHTALQLLELGYEVIGVDLSAGMVQQAETLIRSSNPASRPSFRVGDVEKIPVDDSSVDAVIALGLIEYLSDDDRFVAEIKRVLKPGGIAVIAFRNRLFNLFSLNEYTQREIESGDMAKLLAEFRAEVARRPAVEYAGLLKSMTEQLSAMDRTAPPPPAATPLKALPIHLRQHTPAEARTLFSRAGMNEVAMTYFHYHPFPPVFERANPEIFNRLAVAMEALEDCAAGALLASAFISVFSR